MGGHRQSRGRRPAAAIGHDQGPVRTRIGPQGTKGDVFGYLIAIMVMRPRVLGERPGRQDETPGSALRLRAADRWPGGLAKVVVQGPRRPAFIVSGVAVAFSSGGNGGYIEREISRFASAVMPWD